MKSQHITQNINYPTMGRKGERVAETTIDLERMEHTMKTYVEGRKDHGGMTIFIEDISCDMPLVMESKTKAPLDCIQFVLRYDDGTADIYEHKM